MFRPGIFNVANMSFNAISEKVILMKISEFTVFVSLEKCSYLIDKVL